MEQKWIPVAERLPDTDNYILVSFDNFRMADIGRYELDGEGNGAFYPGDDDKSYVSYGLFVNAWMPLPEPYRGEEPKQTNADRIRSMTDEELAEFLREFLIDNNHEPDTSELYEWLRTESEG